MTPRPRIRVVVLDRDGTLIRHVPYLSDPRQVEVLPTVREGLQLLRDAGVMLALHTNQSGVGRGRFTAADVDACNDEMIRQLGMGAEPFARTCIAMERPDEPQAYRKPSPRFAQELMESLHLGAGELCYIGDNLTDLEAAKNVGCAGVGVDTGGHDLHRVVPATPSIAGFTVVDKFIDAVRYALSLA